MELVVLVCVVPCAVADLVGGVALVAGLCKCYGDALVEAVPHGDGSPGVYISSGVRDEGCGSIGGEGRRWLSGRGGWWVIVQICRCRGCGGRCRVIRLRSMPGLSRGRVAEEFNEARA